MKPTILVYCGEDGGAAKALAASLRDGKSHVICCAASAFDVVQRHADRIVFTKDVPQRLQNTIAAAHGLPIPDGQQLADCKMFQMIREEITKISKPAKRPRGRPRKAA